MKIDDMIRGLQILQPHYKDGYNLGADHDIVYAYPTNTPLTTEEVVEMFNLGWFQPDAPEKDQYAPNEGWAAFV